MCSILPKESLVLRAVGWAQGSAMRRKAVPDLRPSTGRSRCQAVLRRWLAVDGKVVAAFADRACYRPAPPVCVAGSHRSRL